MSKFNDYLERAKRQWGSKFDDSQLSKQFIQFYNNQYRLEIKTYSEIKRGRIGITTGSKPVFLLMLTKRSIGSSYTLSDEDIILKVVSH